MSGTWSRPLLAGVIVAAIAWQGTMMATPFLLMAAAMKRIGASSDGRANVFAFGPMATAERQPIVRPSPDLLYSTCLFDLSHGPVLVRAEPVPGHYWSLSIFDARTDVAAVRSDRDTGGKPAMLALHRPGQAVPAGWEPVTLGYNKGIALIRILLADKSEFATIDAVRRKSSCSAG